MCDGIVFSEQRAQDVKCVCANLAHCGYLGRGLPNIYMNTYYLIKTIIIFLKCVFDFVLNLETKNVLLSEKKYRKCVIATI